MREIITLQSGNYANWVGAAFLNLQIEQDRGGSLTKEDEKDVFFQASKEEASIPRVLIFDVAERLSYFRGGQATYQHKDTSSDAYDIDKEKAAVNWKGAVDVHVMGIAKKQPINNAAPTSWTDICKASIGSRNVVPVDGDGGGQVGWSDEKGGDHLRRLMEECDAVQGLHVFLDLSKNALPYGLRGVEEFVDEAGGGAVSCFCYRTPSPSKEEDNAFLVETALGLRTLLDTGALIIPLSPSSPTGNPSLPLLRESSPYHTSHVHAAAVDVMSRVYRGSRRDSAGCHMREWVHGIRSGANSLASLEIALPFPPLSQANGGSSSSSSSSSRQQLESLLRPTIVSTPSQSIKPDSGLLSHLWCLCPPSSSTKPSPHHPQRRYSALASLVGLPLDSSIVLNTMNDALKYYPWVQPQLNYAAKLPLPLVQHWPFPSLFPPLPSQSQVGGVGCMTMVGCSSAVVSFIQEVHQAFTRRSPMVNARLEQEAGLIGEDLIEVEDIISNLMDDYTTERNLG